MAEHSEETTNEQPKYYVYFVAQAESNFVKIGATSDVGARLRQLQTGNPQRLIILRTIEFKFAEDARDFEALLHERYRRLGYGAYGEWFALSPADILSDINFALELGRRIVISVIRDFPASLEGQSVFIGKFNDSPLLMRSEKGDGVCAGKVEETVIQTYGNVASESLDQEIESEVDE